MTNDGWNEREFLSLPETHRRIELIDGELIVSPSPTWEHQLLVGSLFRHLSDWAQANPPAAIGLSPLDVRLGPGVILQPDLFVIATGIRRDVSGPIDSVPDLAIEVSSANRAYDRMVKRQLYADAGVAEYWIVDRRERRIEVICGLETTNLVSSGDLESRALPGLTLPIELLFP